MKTIMYAALAGVVLTSCMKNEQASTASATVQTQPEPAAEPNEHDPRALDLRADENAIRLIRRSLASNRSIPTNGKDVTLIIADGTITLRGLVRSEQEKIAIGAMARQYAAAKHVDNQLEVVD